MARTGMMAYSAILAAFCVSNLCISNAMASLSSGDDQQTLTDSAKNIFASSPFLLSQMHYVKRSTSILIDSATDDAGEEIVNMRGSQLDLPVGTLLTIVEQSETGEYSTLSLNIEEMIDAGVDVSGMPNLFRVKTSELNLVDLEVIQLTEIDGEEQDYVLPETVAARKKRGRAKMTYCLRDVRLFASSKCGAKIYQTARAADAYNGYLRTGAWVKIKRGSWKAYPKCTACFYGGGRQDCRAKGSKSTACGHAAIKINANQWKGAGVRTVPGLPNKNGTFNGVRRKPYQFHGCLVPKKFAKK